MPRARRTASGAALGLAMAMGLGYVGVHVQHVHDQSGQYRWSPSATPPLVRFEGRDYLRGDAQGALPAGAVRLGRTAGGAWIYGPAGLHEHALTGLDVVDAGRTTAYALAGGP